FLELALEKLACRDERPRFGVGACFHGQRRRRRHLDFGGAARQQEHGEACEEHCAGSHFVIPPAGFRVSTGSAGGAALSASSGSSSASSSCQRPRRANRSASRQIMTAASATSTAASPKSARIIVVLTSGCWTSSAMNRRFIEKTVTAP